MQGASAEATTEVTSKTGILGRNIFSYVKMCGDHFCLQNRSCSDEHSLDTQKQFFSHSKCLGVSASPVQGQPANMYSVLNCDVIDANDDLISSFGQAEITLAIKTLKKELEKKKKSSKKKKKKKNSDIGKKISSVGAVSTRASRVRQHDQDSVNDSIRIAKASKTVQTRSKMKELSRSLSLAADCMLHQLQNVKKTRKRLSRTMTRMETTKSELQTAMTEVNVPSISPGLIVDSAA